MRVLLGLILGSLIAMSDPSSASEGAVVTIRGARFKVGKELGRGMWQVTHEGHRIDRPGERVAIKFSKSGRGDYSKEGGALRRLSGLSHFPTLHGVAETHTAAGPRLALVTELLTGSPLGSSWDHVHTLRPPDKAVRMAMELLRAVREMHGKGIAHNDLTPPNIFMDEQRGSPSIRVIDFGNSSPLGEAGPQKDLKKVGLLVMLLTTGEHTEEVAKLPDVTRAVGAQQVSLRDVVGRAFQGSGYPSAQSFLDALRPFAQ